MFAIYKGTVLLSRTSDPDEAEFFHRLGYTIVNL